MLSPREYQQRTVTSIAARWRLGPCRIACVAPTGAGKTAIGALVILNQGGRWVWLCHTRDLVEQSAAALERALGEPVGIVMAGHPRTGARVQVCSVGTLLARELRPAADGVVIDETHHFASEDWGALASSYDCKLLGLTATPERADGVALRGLFDDLIVAAHYSELIGGGYIVPSRVLRPQKKLRGIALDPVTAYLEHGEGRSGFTFGRTIELCRDLAEKYTAFGVPARCVDAGTDRDERRESIEMLRSGELKMLTSVYALTEGVDVPSASVCVLARGCGHQSLLLQMAGRVLRAALGKTDALILDLPGVTWELGIPHEDRTYSLDGIQRRPEVMSLRVCQKCGFTEPSEATKCTRCGFKLPPKDLAPRIHGEKLTEAVAGNRDLAEQLELSRLLHEAERRGLHDDWVAREFKRSFGRTPELPHNVERKLATYQKMKARCAAQGHSMGRAAYLYKAVYGALPPRSW